MLRFLGKLFLYCIALFMCIITLLFVLDYQGYSDSDYKRFTSPAQYSMIVGTSRAAQGIIPEIINTSQLNQRFRLPIYNFSFNVSASPYGEVYYRAIKDKLIPNIDSTSLFIVAVDPFALAEEDSLDNKSYREKGLCVDLIKRNHKPQFLYLLKYCRPYKWTHYDNVTLHDDGWLEVFGVSMDSCYVAENVCRKMVEYEQFHLTPSTYRIYWLCRTVELLRSNGSVVLCRIPVSHEMLEWENKQWPEFDTEIITVADKYHVPYYSFVKDCGKYQTTDGNHLYKDDGILFTQALCDSITLPLSVNYYITN